MNEKLYRIYKNTLIYDISYKTFMVSKPLRIRFDEIHAFMKIYDGVKYLLLSGSERYFDKNRIASSNSLPIEKH